MIFPCIIDSIFDSLSLHKGYLNMDPALVEWFQSELSNFKLQVQILHLLSITLEEPDTLKW